MKSLIKITKLWKLFFLGALLLAFAVLLLSFNLPCMAYPNVNPFSALPTTRTGGANLINNLNNQNSAIGNTGTNITTATASTNIINNQWQLINEIHIVKLVSQVSLANYQAHYLDCANGGTYVTNSLVAVSPTVLYYYCTLPVYPWYSSTSKPVYYDQPNNITFAQVLTGFVNWVNPRLPASVGSEQINASPAFAYGIPLTTFLTENCTNVGGPANAFDSNRYNIWLYGFLYEFASISLGFANETDTPAAWSNGCSGVASAVVAVIPNQVVPVTINYNTQVYLIAEADSTPTTNHIGTPNSHPVEASPPGISTNQSATCAANYTVQTADVGNTVYIICLCPANSNESGLPSGCPVATNAATSQYLVTSNSAFPWNSLLPWIQSYSSGGLP